MTASHNTGKDQSVLTGRFIWIFTSIKGWLEEETDLILVCFRLFKVTVIGSGHIYISHLFVRNDLWLIRGCLNIYSTTQTIRSASVNECDSGWSEDISLEVPQQFSHNIFQGYGQMQFDFLCAMKWKEYYISMEIIQSDLD